MTKKNLLIYLKKEIIALGKEQIKEAKNPLLRSGKGGAITTLSYLIARKHTLKEIENLLK